MIRADEELSRCEVPPPMNSIIIDHFLWDFRREHDAEMKNVPFHRTRCIYYWILPFGLECKMRTDFEMGSNGVSTYSFLQCNDAWWARTREWEFWYTLDTFSTYGFNCWLLLRCQIILAIHCHAVFRLMRNLAPCDSELLDTVPCQACWLLDIDFFI